jgi:hypothetical protein
MPEETDRDRVEVFGSLTKDRWEREFVAERDYVHGQINTLLAKIDVEREKCKGQHYVTVQRFEDLDKATELLSATVNRVPTDLQTAIGQVLTLMNERDRRIGDHFEAIKSLRESEMERSEKMLQQALAYQKETTAVSTASLDRIITSNAQLSVQAIDSLSARVTILSEQIVRNQQQIAEILAGNVAVSEQRVDTRGASANVYGIVGSIVGILAFVLAMALAITRLYTP